MAYQGRQPGVGVRNRFIYSATGGQTSFSGADSNGLTLAYSDATYVDVFLNGTLLVPVTDYAATTKTSVVLGSGAAASDIVEIVAYDISSMSGAVNKTGGTMTGDLSFGDNDKAKFGAGSDLQIYSDGTHSRIYESGSGLLIVRASNFNVNNADGSDSYITMQDGGAVTAYYDGSAKLATTATGIQVTGNIANTSGDFTLDVANDINLDSGDGDIQFKDTGTTFMNLYESSNNAMFYNPISDADIRFQGKDNTTVITALTLDMSDGGAAKFGAGGYSNTKGVTVFGSQGQIWVTSESSTGGYFNRKGSDGAVITLAKEDADKGFIGINNGDPYIARNSGSGMRWYNGAVVPTNDAGNDSNNTMDLGSNSVRFKDLYLSGRVTTSSQPSFAASKNNGHLTSGVMVFNDVRHNVGSHYNASNGRFTAPVTGRYFIGSMLMSHNDATYNNSSYRIAKNGSTFQFVYSSSGSAVHHQWQWSGIISLSANDYVTIEYNNTKMYGDSSAYSWFSGHLLG